LSRIVNGESVEKHIIHSYEYKNLETEEVKEQSGSVKNVYDEPETSVQKIQEENKQNEIIEKLLGKIEELGNNIVNIQSQFEKQLNECKALMESEKKKAYEEGYQKGFEEAKNKISSETEEKLNLLSASLRKIDKINETFEEKILSIEKELISVALDIAKEVIQKEVSENSKEIAYSLAKALMDDIKDATKIQIKVNPKDAEFLKSQDLKNVEIIEDEAVKEGGVVIISDIGNIDAEILQRFKAIKEAILENNE